MLGDTVNFHREIFMYLQVLMCAHGLTCVRVSAADEALLFRQKHPKRFPPVRGPAGPSASNQDGCATRSAQTVLAEKSIRGCGSAAPNAGTQNS